MLRATSARILHKVDTNATRKNGRSTIRVEEIVDRARGGGVDSRHLFQVGDGGALDRTERSKMPQQSALAGRADAGNFLQAGAGDILLAANAMRADGETMRL